MKIKEPVEISSDEWDDKYIQLWPEEGPLSLEQIKEKGYEDKIEFVWTIVEADDSDKLYLLPGLRRVNSVDYVVTKATHGYQDIEVPWLDPREYE